MKRSDRDEILEKREVKSDVTSGLPMFEQARETPSWAPTVEELAKVHSRDVERLVPVARELAGKAKGAGIIMEDVRVVAVGRGILTGREGSPDPKTGRLTKPRELSWLAAVPRAAGLVATGRRRYNSAGNPSMIWVLRDHYSEGAA